MTLGIEHIVRTPVLDLLLILITAANLTACANLEKILPRYSDNRIEKVHLVAAPNVNRSTPVAVDIVYVFEESLVTELMTFTARKWFEEKSALSLLYPDQFAIFGFELVPNAQGTLIPRHEKQRFPKPHQKAAKVLVYSNYLRESKDYTLDISPFKQPFIRLGEQKVSIEDKGK